MEAELRSLSQGLASYEAEFDHLAELNGKLADKVVQQLERLTSPPSADGADHDAAAAATDVPHRLVRRP